MKHKPLFLRVLSDVMIYDESFHRTLILNCTFIYRYWNQPTVQQTTMASKVRSTYNVTRSVSTLKNFETNIVCQGSTNEAYMCRLVMGWVPKTRVLCFGSMSFFRDSTDTLKF